MAIKGRSTQSLVNNYPPWSNIRRDEQSLGYQILNSTGQAFDDLRKQLQRISDNFYLPTAIISDIDTFYSFKLPYTYTFEKEDTDVTDLPYTPPLVSGFRDGAYHSVTVLGRNNIESFWYETVPSELVLAETVTRPYLLVEDTVDHSPFTPATPSGWCHATNQLTIEISDGETYLTLEDNNLLSKGLVQVHGITRTGQEVWEELVFLFDETQKTLYEYQQIYPSGIRVYGVNPTTAQIKVSSANFNAPDYALEYNLDVDVEDHDSPLFWALGSGTTGVATLDLKTYESNSLELRLEGFTDKQVLLQQKLLDSTDAEISPVDLAIEPRTNHVWIADSTKLYIFDGRLPYPEQNQLTKKQFDSACVIEPSSYWVVPSDTVEIDYVWLKPTLGIYCHRAWVQKPDGNKYSLEQGVEVTYHTDTSSWVYGEPTSREMRPAEFYQLDQVGDYIYTLETKYSDDTTSIDQRIVTSAAKNPLATYDLSSLGISNPIVGIDFDSEYKLWVLDNTDTIYKLNLRYDHMLIDFDKKIIYFREPYTLVRVF